MKKTLFTIALAATIGLMMTACGENEVEMTKMLSNESVTIDGTHDQLLDVSDSVKVILTNPSGKDNDWEVQMIIPMTSTIPWSEVDGTDPKADTYYTPKMGNLSVDFTDANEAEIDYDIRPDWDVVKALLASEKVIEKKVTVKPLWGGKKYKDAKVIFDKVAGAKITRADLDKTYNSSSSSSSSSSYSSTDIDDDDIDFDDLEKAVDASQKALKAAGKAAKAANSKDMKDALDAYGDVLDAYGSMLK
ncbi:MAG: hypothetical protein IJR13_02165 [Bacteroidales bacterium]|nr:hypothetical protein [Bacteroidales bacterium]